MCVLAFTQNYSLMIGSLIKDGNTGSNQELFTWTYYRPFSLIMLIVLLQQHLKNEQIKVSRLDDSYSFSLDWAFSVF